jgi:alpha-amylase/alpha-mannosidase (GH57 family)
MSGALNVVLCWHMHQPWYRVDGRFSQPWVYLHALKDYSDMAAHLESVPGARAVVNFVPILLEQIALYRHALADHFERGVPLPDPLLDALARLDLPTEPQAREALLADCRHVHEKHVLGRYPAYARLVEMMNPAGHARYLNDAFFADLLVWFHLAWLGEHVRRHDPRVQALLAKERGYSATDRRVLLGVIREVLDSVIDRYARLQQEGRVELAVSPWAHPILPLLLDYQAARAALPHAELPSHREYPGGQERVRWHLDRARHCAAEYFGSDSGGCWPSEGAISMPALEAIAAAGFHWCASGGGVLANSLAASHQTVECQHRPFTAGGTACFFRDDGLSDLIGFQYKDWHAEDAVANLIGHLETIGRHCNRPDAVVAIVLDGENAWESYPHNGYEFLQALYRALAEHADLELTTFDGYLRKFGVHQSLERIVAGSWVYGTLSTWMGDPDKNRAWDLLTVAKQHYDRHRDELGNGEEVERLLAICEGSDWFWWFGEHNAAAVVARFETLFRAHLRALYQALGVAPPAELEQPLSHGDVAAGVHTMRQGSNPEGH